MKGEKWSDEETTRLSEHLKNGRYVSEILDDFPGRTAGAVRSRAAQLRLKEDIPVSRTKRQALKRAEVLRLIREGKTCQEIKREVHVTGTTLADWRAELEIEGLLPVSHIADDYSLDEEILRLYNQGYSLNFVANALGINWNRVKKRLEILGKNT